METVLHCETVDMQINNNTFFTKETLYSIKMSLFDIINIVVQILRI